MLGIASSSTLRVCEGTRTNGPSRISLQLGILPPVGAVTALDRNFACKVIFSKCANFSRIRPKPLTAYRKASVFFLTVNRHHPLSSQFDNVISTAAVVLRCVVSSEFLC